MRTNILSAIRYRKGLMKLVLLNSLFVFSLISCEKSEEIVETGGSDIVTIEASIANSTTKTLLGEGEGEPVSYPVLWSDGDAIAVINNGKLFKFVVDKESVGKRSGKFISSEAEGFDPSMDMVAYYPFSAVNSFDESTINCTVAPVQSYMTNAESGNGCSTFCAGAAHMSGYKAAGAAGALQFKNLFGVLKLRVTGTAGEKISKVEVVSNIEPYGTSISGPAQIAYKDQGGRYIQTHSASLTGAELANRSVVLDCSASPVQLTAEAVEFLVALPANNHDLTIIFTDSNGNRRIVRTVATKTVTAGEIMKMPVVAYTPASGEYIVTETSGKKSYYGVGTVIDGASWAPVNCGYEPATSTSRGYTWGKYYQWGRQYGQGASGQVHCAIYPFPTSSDETYPSIEDETIVIGTVSLSEGQSFDNRYKMYQEDLGVTWLNSEDYKTDLWNRGTEENPVKGLYDPCPDGWRVPSLLELESLGITRFTAGINNGQSGCWASGSKSYSEGASAIFLPCSGCMVITDSKEYGIAAGVYGRNSDALYGSSWPATSESAYHIIEADSWHLDVAGHKSDAYAIRCIRE